MYWEECVTMLWCGNQGVMKKQDKWRDKNKLTDPKGYNDWLMFYQHLSIGLCVLAFDAWRTFDMDGQTDYNVMHWAMTFSWTFAAEIWNAHDNGRGRTYLYLFTTKGLNWWREWHSIRMNMFTGTMVRSNEHGLSAYQLSLGYCTGLGFFLSLWQSMDQLCGGWHWYGTWTSDPLCLGVAAWGLRPRSYLPD